MIKKGSKPSASSFATPDAFDRDGLPVDYKTAPWPKATTQRPADVVLRAGENPRPEGRGWALVDYRWKEETGLARLTYQRHKQRRIVEVPQPAGMHHKQWGRASVHRAAATDPAVLERYFEAQHVNMAMSAIGAYGR